MTTTIDPGPLRLARAAAQRLNVQEKAQLISELAQEIAQVGAPAARTVSPEQVADPQPRRGDPHAMVAAALAAGPWEGEDLEERLQAVYAARGPLRFEGVEE